MLIDLILSSYFINRIYIQNMIFLEKSNAETNRALQIPTTRPALDEKERNIQRRRFQRS